MQQVLTNLHEVNTKHLHKLESIILTHTHEIQIKDRWRGESRNKAQNLKAKGIRFQWKQQPDLESEEAIYSHSLRSAHYVQ